MSSILIEYQTNFVLASALVSAQVAVISPCPKGVAGKSKEHIHKTYYKEWNET